MAEVTRNTPGAYWDTTSFPYSWKVKKNKGLGGSGSTGSFNYAEDTPMTKQSIQDMMSLRIAEEIKKNQSAALGGGAGGGSIWSGLKNMFSWGDDKGDSKDTKEKGSGTDWGKWLTFAKGIMDWNTSQEEIELGKEQNRLGRDQLGFKRTAYADEVERKDTEYYDQVNNVNQQRKSQANFPR